MDIRVASDARPPPSGPHGALRWKNRVVPCALGRAGVTAKKREGDGATPAGRFPLRRVLYRADRICPPRTALPVAPIAPEDGWCDDPNHPHYNRQVRLPFDGGYEPLWRDDHAYDVIVILGHNDSPPRPGAGSAIFLHVARPAYAPTQGCVALALADLLQLLADCKTGDRLSIDVGGGNKGPAS